MSFNSNSFLNTQNTGAKPTVLVGYAGAFAVGTGYTGLTAPLGSAPTRGDTTFMYEGEVAQTNFLFATPGSTVSGPSNHSSVATGSLTELMDSATVSISWDGTSTQDVEGGSFEYIVMGAGGSWGSWADVGTPNGVVTSLLSASGKEGTFSFTDQATDNPTVGTGAYGIAVRLKVVTDTLTESGEHVMFKFTQNSATKFTDSFYIESKVNILDANLMPNTEIVTAGAVAKAGTAAADVFKISNSFIGAHPVLNFATIGGAGVGETFGAGDKLKVDMATGDQLSMVSFGNLASPAGITTQTALLNGLRALDKTDCNVGGVYYMTVTEGGTNNTYVLFDSNGNGKLDTQTDSNGPINGGDFDVFVKLAGVNFNTIQSTHFDLY